MSELQIVPVAAIATDTLGQALVAERPRLVRLCRQWTRSPEVADDLAQETLIEALRLLDRLHDPEGMGAWLTAIARNVCRRWSRANGREQARIASATQPESAWDDAPDPFADALGVLAEHATPDEASDPATQVERAEITALLRRALATLPDDTRALTLASLVAETPTPELARKYRLSEGAVRARVHRGRVALRQALCGELRAEAEALDLALPDTPRWTESRIWCPFCGAAYVRYHIDPAAGMYAFRCSRDCPGRAVAGWASCPELVNTVSNPKSLITRHCLMLATSYREALVDGVHTCDCGRPFILTARLSGNGVLSPETPYGIEGICPNCGLVDAASAWHLALDTPEAQRFWRRYPRMRALPMQMVEHDGRVAIVTGFAAVGSSARLDMVSDAKTYTVLHVETQGAL